jgi:hypothetical protein
LSLPCLGLTELDQRLLDFLLRERERDDVARSRLERGPKRGHARLPDGRDDREPREAVVKLADERETLAWFHAELDADQVEATWSDDFEELARSAGLGREAELARDRHDQCTGFGFVGRGPEQLDFVFR